MTYARQIETAAKLIKAKGGPCLLTVFVDPPETPNPWETTTNPTSQTLDCIGVFLRFSTSQYGQTFANGDVIHASDKKVLVAAKGLAFAPNLKGRLVQKFKDGTEKAWSIAGIDPLAPNGDETIMYTLQVRQ